MRRFYFLFSIFYLLSFFGAVAQEGAQEVRPNARIKINISLNTQDEVVNVVSGDVVYPKDLLAFEGFEDGGSLVSVWIDRFVEKDGRIHYAGMIPGGYQGSEGYVASLIFEAKKPGEAQILIDNVKAFRHDGLGTEIPLPSSSVLIAISHDAPEPEGVIGVIDSTAPEPFSIFLSREGETFEGKWFIVFLAQDKGVGIDHYEVAERREVWGVNTSTDGLEWERVESPYVLKDQLRLSRIFVKAIDRAGNETVVELAPQPMPFSIIITVIVVVVFAVFFLWYSVRERRRLPQRESHNE